MPEPGVLSRALVVKANLDTAGMLTTGGTVALRNHRPATNAPTWQRCIDAGAILFGKTNMPEVAG